jgi:dolichyl-phosphate-mannose-protein mannosyltransferase
VKYKNHLFALFLSIGAFLLFSIDINSITELIFDEFHYIPAAKRFLAGEWQANLEHPPLGKMLIALSLLVGGDNPWGHRLGSMLCGSLCMIPLYFYGLNFFGKAKYGVTLALLTLFNSLLYVNARVAMLEIYVLFFSLCSLALFQIALDQKEKINYMWFAGLFLGAALATKLSAIPLIFIYILTLISSRHLNLDLLKKFFVQVLVFAAFCYFITYVPRLINDPAAKWYSLLSYQWEMLDAQSRVGGTHPYQSEWYDWPLMLRPIWYYYKNYPDGYIRGITLIGNPFIMWGGVISIFYSVYDFIKNKSYRGYLIFISYACLYFFWAVVPRQLSFYYYYVPASIFLGVAMVKLAKDLDRRYAHTSTTLVILSALVFFYFYPVLSGMKVNLPLSLWTWFDSWV